MFDSTFETDIPVSRLYIFLFNLIHFVTRADESYEMKDEKSGDVLKISKDVLLLGINDQNTDIR